MKKSYLIVILFFSHFSFTAEPVPQPAPQAADIIKQLLDKKQKEFSKRNEKEGALKNPFGDPLDSYKRFYPYYEANVDAIMKVWPQYELTGTVLNYGMSWEAITRAVVDKFKQMYKNGQILTKQEFEKKNKSEWWPHGNDLTRIWGAEFLSKKFHEEKREKFKTPRYIIVVDDLSKIKVKVSFNQCFPAISKIMNGEVYAEKVKGKPAAKKGLSIIGYGYTDYSDPGNIYLTEDGIYYVLDTEYKSFYDGSPRNHLLKNINGPACEYFEERFKLLNKIDGIDKVVEFALP